VTAQSPAIHEFFQKEFIEGKLVGNREYLFDQIPALMSVYDGGYDPGELVAAAPKMSLKAQGLLGKPTTPMLVIGGTLDTQVPIPEAYLLLDSGDVPRKHGSTQGRTLGPAVKVWPDPVIFRQVIIPWLLRALDVHSPEAPVRKIASQLHPLLPPRCSAHE